MKPAGNAPIYALGLYPDLAEFFRCRGYALAIHGSCNRDFDLIAVPWVDEAWAPADVVAGLTQHFSLRLRPGREKPTRKPHGRLAWSLHLSFGELYLDISFVPRRRRRPA